MNILVVDDESFFIEELVRLVDRYREQTGQPIQVGRTAYSAEEALLFLESGEHFPDAIFTDIRMASLDGLDLARTIHERWPELPVAIVSGYPSFEYAREALRAHVQDYILKPIDVPGFNGLLERLYERFLDRQYEDRQAWLNRLLLLDRADTASDWIRSAPCGPDALPVHLLRSPEPAYSVEDWLVRNAGEEAARERQIWICRRSRRELVVFAEDDGLRAIVARAPFPVSVACAGSLGDWSRLHPAIDALSSALDRSAIIGRSAWIDGMAAESKPAADQADLSVSPMLSALARKKDWTVLLKEARRAFSNWQSKELPVKTVAEGMNEIVRLAAAESGETIPDAIRSAVEQLSEDVQGAFAWEEAWKAFEGAISRIIGRAERENEPNGGSAALYHNIASYLAQHYMEPITAQLLAEMFHISRTTLYHLFREYGNTTYIDYLTDIRMNIAKQLIASSPDMKMKDIAECAGYADHHYFSRAFKAATGQTPSEYRETSN